MGISRKLGLAGGWLWARLHHAMRLETWGLATQVGAMKLVRIVSFRVSLLSAMAGCVLLLAAQAGLAASTQISGGAFHTMAIEPDGSLWTWGGNNYAQLGDSATMGRTIPAQIGIGYSAVAAGYLHSLALKADGSLWGWGDNPNGQLGDGTTTRRPSPVPIGTGYSAVSTFSYHTVALKVDGKLWAWGTNDHGQLGDGSAINRYSPVEVIGTGYNAVAVGDHHTVALKSDGSLWTWGSNSAGQLGNGTTSDVLYPTQIGTGFSAIAAGANHSVALKPDGSIWTWGANSFGQLGSSTPNNVLTPTPIGTGYRAIAAGENHTVALKADGSVWTWGYNSFGQLGDGSTVNRSTPAQVGTGYSLIGAGQHLTYAGKANGSLWVTGWNNYGQIGDGTTITPRTSLTPINFTLAILDTTAPTVPTGLTATAPGANQVNLSWTASTDNVGVTAYKLYRGGVLLATLGSVASYSDTGLTATTAYSYTVSACDAAGNCSAQSSAVSATTGATPDTAAPAVPVGLAATAVGANQIDLNWTASTDNIGVTAYKLYRGGVLLATLGNVTNYSDTGLTATTAYSYTVSACDAAGNCSAQSSATSATTGASAASLAGLTLSCPATIGSGSSAICTANGSYSDGSSKSVTAAWTSSNTAAATINASGQITAAGVTADTPVTISASYSESGVTKTANATVTITVAAAQATNDCSGTGKYLTGITIAGGAAKKVGDTLDVNYCLKNFSKVSRFDIYVAVKVPDNSLLYMKSSGFFGSPIFNSSVTPYLKNTLLPDLSGPVLSMPELPLELPLGSYTFYAVPVLTGKSVENTANWIGQISQGTFTLSW